MTFRRFYCTQGQADILVISAINPKQSLDDFLSTLFNGIECQIIQNEADIVQMFRVETEQQLALWEMQYGIRKKPSLLELLGYSASDVDERPVKKTVVGQINYAPDYILKRQQKLLAIVDLKAPGQNLDHERWIGQISSYCRELKVPLGLLFNGTEVRVFINTDYKGLTKHRELFFNQPVASAGSHERKQMVDILLKFAAITLEVSPIVVANGFASKRRHELRDRERQKRIRHQLKSVLANPPSTVFAAISSLDNIWGDIEPKPSEAELSAAWVETMATPGPTNSRRKSRLHQSAV